MRIKIKANLHGLYGVLDTKDIVYWGTMEDMKKELSVVEYNGSMFEFTMYSDTTEADYNIEAHFSRITYYPSNTKPYRIVDGNSYYKPPQCICGSEKVGSPRHSEWCEKYKRHE